jgi:hypothetical protein
MSSLPRASNTAARGFNLAPSMPIASSNTSVADIDFALQKPTNTSTTSTPDRDDSSLSVPDSPTFLKVSEVHGSLSPDKGSEQMVNSRFSKIGPPRRTSSLGQLALSSVPASRPASSSNTAAKDDYDPASSTSPAPAPASSSNTSAQGLDLASSKPSNKKKRKVLPTSASNTTVKDSIPASSMPSSGSRTSSPHLPSTRRVSRSQSASGAKM